MSVSAFRSRAASMPGSAAEGCRYANVVKDRGRVAQLVEQCPFKAWVAGSNPAALTINFSNLESALRGAFEFLHKFLHKSGTVDLFFRDLDRRQDRIGVQQLNRFPRGTARDVR